MNVIVFGTGYVGLVTGACLAHIGNNVVCIDKNVEIVKKINSGKASIYEPGLQEILEDNINNSNLKASENLREFITEAEVIIIAVGTPSDRNGSIDLSQVINAIKEISENIKFKQTYTCIIVKSTVVPGTTANILSKILEKELGSENNNWGIGMNPEFLREGSAVKDFMEPDRIVLGANSESAKNYMQLLYSTFEVPKIITNTTTAEFIKYSNNTLLALLISFSNELSRIADKLPGVDIKDVMKGIHLDNRWSPLINYEKIFPSILSYLDAGCGYGGSCFPKDVSALKNFADKIQVKTSLINCIQEINDSQKEYSIEHVSRIIGELRGLTFLILGLSFKPDTDDVRESPSIEIIKSLIRKGAKIYAHDPLKLARNNFKSFSSEIIKEDFVLIENIEEILSEINGIYLVTAWKEYINYDWGRVIRMNKNIKIFYDGRRVINSEIFKDSNCIYSGIGYNKYDRNK